MDESWFRLISLIVATGIFGFIHWTISKHIKDGSERKIILSLECIVLLCLFGAFIKREITDVAGTNQTHASLGEEMAYLFGALFISLLIYRLFAWGKT